MKKSPKLRRDKKFPEIDKEIAYKQKIIQFLQNPDDNVDLPKRVKELYLKCDFCDNLLRAKFSNKQIVNRLRYKFKISRSQAYRIIRKTMIEFSPISYDEMNYYKGYLLESIIESIRLAKFAGPKALQYRIEAESNLMKLLRIDKKENPIIPYLTKQIIHITTDPAAIGLPEIKK